MAKTTRELLAAQANVGGIKFWATGAPHGGSRRIAEYPYVGSEGNDTEDMGSPAQRHPLKATLDEAVYQALFDKMHEGKVIDAVHPLFGVIRARIASVKCEVPLEDMVDVEIELIEHGQRTTQVLPVTLGAAAQAAKGLWDDLSTDLDGLADIEDLPDAVSTAADTFSNAWDSFDSILDLAEQGAATWEELAASYGSLGDAAQGFVDQVDDAIHEVGDLVETTVVDQAYLLMNAARDAVDAVQSEVTRTWRKFTAAGPIPIAQLATEWLGSDSEKNITAILDANPDIIDVGIIVEGAEIMIPIAA